MDVKWAYSKPGSEVILHHGNWTRVAVAGSPNVTYYPADVGGSILVGARSLVILRGAESSASNEYAPRNTGERQTHLGESCTVWEVSRTRISPLRSQDIIGTSCVSDDGIELWWKRASPQSVSSGEATKIERRPIAPDDARPPSSAFALNWPERDALPAIPPEKPDHEVVMEASPPGQGATGTRAVRRHGPWQFTEEIDGKRHSIVILHDYRQFWLQYSTDESGAPKRLVFHRFAFTPDEQAKFLAASRQPASMNKTDTALGETCHWFDMTPGMQDAGSSACLTDDNIALKEASWSWGHGSGWTAIRLTRRPIAIDELKPPADVLSPKTWGVD
jgi:hypothetical protein